jgi:crotonobetainyl-CoA:carnitine CoA-transferase CaiB-like acyl-CoA transferase
MAGPLRGLRVLDLSRVLAGPWCAQMLADLGAEVIKVERPGTGDDTRHWGPPWLAGKDGSDTDVSAYYLASNRGKRSITIDIGTRAGRDLVRRLAARSDVLIENFKVGDLGRKGLGYGDLAALVPGLIYCSITGFGQTGPLADRPGYDYLIQGQGGLMSITGLPDDEAGGGPQRVGVAISDLTTGMNAAVAILAALYHRERTGEGQYIDMALLDVQVSWLANQAQNYFCSGEAPVRTGAQHPNLAPYQPFRTADGSLIIAVGNEAQFARLCSALGLDGLASDSRFATNAARVRNRTALVEKIEAVTRTRPSADLSGALEAARVPHGPVRDIAGVFDDPQVRARGMVVDLEHPLLGSVRTVANPIRYSATPIEYGKAPPVLGEDTDSVLADVLGIDSAGVAELRARGVV